MRPTAPSSRLGTRMDMFGVHEYKFTLTLATRVALSPGTYWVEIINATVDD